MTVPFNLSSLWNGLIGRREREDRDAGHQPDSDLHAKVGAAHKEWQAAQQYFQTVSEPQLVDHAVHALIAAERKYMYLLHQLREGQKAAPGQGE